MTAAVGRDLVVVSCAISAGIHLGLVPEHYSESPVFGGSFAVAAVALAGTAVVIARRPYARHGLIAAALVLSGLIAGYALAVTVGLPFLHPEPEPVEGIAVATKLVEAGGLLAALFLLLGGSAPLRQKGLIR